MVAQELAPVPAQLELVPKITPIALPNGKVYEAEAAFALSQFVHRSSPQTTLAPYEIVWPTANRDTDNKRGRGLINKLSRELNPLAFHIVTVDDIAIKRQKGTRTSTYYAETSLVRPEIIAVIPVIDLPPLDQMQPVPIQRANAVREVTKPQAVPNQEDERNLVDRARTGDREAMGSIYDLYLTPVYRYVLAHVGSPVDAEDITHEVFVRIAEHIGRFEWRGVPFSAWVLRIARNQAISYHRRRGGRPVSVSTDDFDIEDGSPGPEPQVEHALTMAEVNQACFRLPPAQQQVLALRFGSGLSVRETAGQLGKTENNVKVLQHKAIAKLQHWLNPR